MRIYPPKQIQLIFHRGAKRQEQPSDKLLAEDSGLLIWKENDRVVAAFNGMASLVTRKAALVNTIQDWITDEISHATYSSVLRRSMADARH